jgi:hypothetical protein
MHIALQGCPGPFWAPSSQSSPASITPSPQKGAAPVVSTTVESFVVAELELELVGSSPVVELVGLVVLPTTPVDEALEVAVLQTLLPA